MEFLFRWKTIGIGVSIISKYFFVHPILIPEDCDTIISVQEGLFAEDFMVFPNPTMDAIQVALGKYERVSIGLFNVVGQKVLEFDFEGEMFTVDLTGFSSGIYHLFIETNERKQSKKTIIINKI